MNKSGYEALARMIESHQQNSNNYFVPDAIGLDPDSLAELLLSGVVESAGDINEGVYFDIEAARRFAHSD